MIILYYLYDGFMKLSRSNNGFIVYNLFVAECFLYFILNDIIAWEANALVGLLALGVVDSVLQSLLTVPSPPW